MKNYFKILFITLAIQLSGVMVGLLLSELQSGAGMLNGLGTIFLLGCVPAAIIVDIVLAIRWGTNIKQKLIYIFLMPTNYLWLVFVLWLVWHISQWMNVLTNIYK